MLKRKTRKKGGQTAARQGAGRCASAIMSHGDKCTVRLRGCPIFVIHSDDTSLRFSPNKAADKTWTVVTRRAVRTGEEPAKGFKMKLEFTILNSNSDFSVYCFV